MEKTIVVTCPAPGSVRAAVEEGAADYAEILYLEDAPEGGRAAMLSSANALVSFFFNKEIKEEEYPLLENLEVLQSVSTGLDFLPFDKMPQKPVLLCNAGGWAPQIAEHTMALLLALSRRIIPLHNDLAKGVFNRDAFSPMSLRGKVLTVAGYGGIGRAAAELARAFGMKIRALNSTGKTNGDVDFMGTLKDLDTVLPDTDVLLLSLPLNKHTRGIIGEKELRLMKKNAILLNVARAPLVVEEALYNHMKENPDFQAGFDVWWKEPTWGGGDFALDFPFMELANIAGSPHNSNRCDQGMEKATLAAVSNLTAFFKGEKFGGLIRREDYMV
ncbi:MAG: 2-hydroxyacid dehydrogenase [Aminivibrio sp.]|nr:hydroxyacid dehydrogenase [Synergistaceae bacterium]